MITILVTLIIVGFILWAANTYIPMAPPVKAIINVLVIIALIVWLLKFANIQ